MIDEPSVEFGQNHLVAQTYRYSGQFVENSGLCVLAFEKVRIFMREVLPKALARLD